MEHVILARAVHLGEDYNTWSSTGGDIRIVKDRAISLTPYILGRYLVRAPFDSEVQHSQYGNCLNYCNYTSLKIDTGGTNSYTYQ